jgi:hypothetical protein
MTRSKENSKFFLKYYFNDLSSLNTFGSKMSFFCEKGRQLILIYSFLSTRKMEESYFKKEQEN